VLRATLLGRMDSVRVNFQVVKTDVLDGSWSAVTVASLAAHIKPPVSTVRKLDVIDSRSGCGGEDETLAENRTPDVHPVCKLSRLATQFK
jgi:hypothetical protein